MTIPVPLLEPVQQKEYLRQFDNHTFFFYLLTAGAAPFAHAAFSEWFIGSNILSELEREKHITRILATLLVPTSESLSEENGILSRTLSQ